LRIALVSVTAPWLSRARSSGLLPVVIERKSGGNTGGHWRQDTCLQLAIGSGVRFAFGPMPLRFSERQAAAYTACSNAIRVSNTCSSLAGRICIMMTAATRRFGSTQKKVLWTPAQARL